MMKRVLITLAVALMFNVPNAVADGYVAGTINSVFAGKDDHYGVRFYLNVTDPGPSNVCNQLFVYVEPELNSGAQAKIAVFMMAYAMGKPVILTTTYGRDGYCKLVEGQTK